MTCTFKLETNRLAAGDKRKIVLFSVTEVGVKEVSIYKCNAGWFRSSNACYFVSRSKLDWFESAVSYLVIFLKRENKISCCRSNRIQ